MSSSSSFAVNWRTEWKNSRFRIQWFASLLVLVSIALSISHFFNYVQHRDGIVLDDPVLNALQPIDLSPFTFSLIYGALLFSIIYLSFYPQRLLLFIQVYCLTTLLRMLCIFLVPLNNPPGIIVLQDPFVKIIGYGGQVITKDLFFSGHVSTLFLLCLTTNNKILRVILLLITLTVACFILVQHVHYTIDVLAAPIFSWIAWRSVNYFLPVNS